MAWTTTDCPSGVHVVPESGAHTESEDCACGPAVELHGNTCWCYGGQLYIRKVVTHR